MQDIPGHQKLPLPDFDLTGEQRKLIQENLDTIAQKMLNEVNRVWKRETSNNRQVYKIDIENFKNLLGSMLKEETKIVYYSQVQFWGNFCNTGITHLTDTGVSRNQLGYIMRKLASASFIKTYSPNEYIIPVMYANSIAVAFNLEWMLKEYLPNKNKRKREEENTNDYPNKESKGAGQKEPFPMPDIDEHKTKKSSLTMDDDTADEGSLLGEWFSMFSHRANTPKTKQEIGTSEGLSGTPQKERANNAM